MLIDCLAFIVLRRRSRDFLFAIIATVTVTALYCPAGFPEVDQVVSDISIHITPGHNTSHLGRCPKSKPCYVGIFDQIFMRLTRAKLDIFHGIKNERSWMMMITIERLMLRTLCHTQGRRAS